ncbi:MAG: glyoxalase/bleomycin resistance protein/dioxygenase [Acidimicrobiales bacterium]|nr:glyoxalase/bleomycin resistance protein/dioxygenase [Acidimicrobiales bacterium]
MSLHRLLGMRVAVPRPDELAGFYGEVGLGTAPDGRITSPDGGPQVTIEEGAFRRLAGVELGAAAEQDLDDVAARLSALGLAPKSAAGAVEVTDPTTQVRFSVTVCEPLTPGPASVAAVDNRPGATSRRNRRAPGVFEAARPPRRLGHVVIGTPDIAATRRVLVDGLGFKVSDELDGVIAFMRCSTDHHNVALVHSPVPILQHYSWECDDTDHVGHAATALLRTDAARQAWGLGRHHVGSNYFWYLRDPSGSFIELFSDLDVIDDDDEWESTGRTEIGFEHVALSWGPDIPLEFIAPADLPELQAAWGATT